MIKNVEVELPAGLEIRASRCGYGLFSTRAVPAGQVIYRHRSEYVPDDDSVYELKVLPSGQTYRIDKTNSVLVGSRRELYTFDGFMNHSCNQNSFSRQISKDEFGFQYQTIARRNILLGEEITCNYLLFDYTCDGHSFECSCGSQPCYGEIKGFKGLSLSQQVSLLAQVSPEIKEMWLADKPFIRLVEDLEVPASIQISQGAAGNTLRLLKEVKAGQRIYKYRYLRFEQEQEVVYRRGQNYNLVDKLNMTINRGDYRIFFYFDSFMNHGCEPNVASQEDEADGSLEMFALKDMAPGTELLEDYSSFDLMNDNQLFRCLCGSPKCKGWI